MTKYLEQTGWLLNPKPDGRKSGRHAKQCWLPGTRWIFEESEGIVRGGGMTVSGVLAETIVAQCKEVEPGFGAILDDMNFSLVIGELIDQGKITVADLQDVLKQDEQWEDEDEDAESDSDSESSELLLRLLLQQHEYRYRHWLTLDPPSEELIRNATEQDRRKAIVDEYANRTQKPS
jgi:hypothetical protein